MTKASQSLSNWISKYITTPPSRALEPICSVSGSSVSQSHMSRIYGKLLRTSF